MSTKLVYEIHKYYLPPWQQHYRLEGYRAINVVFSQLEGFSLP